MCSLLVKASSFLIVLEGKFAQMLLQGLSGAGLQLGLDDPRSALVRQPFRVFDELEDPCRAQVVLTIWVGCCHDCLNQVLLRLGLLLENVLALLSKQEKTRKVWKYILKAWFTFFFGIPLPSQVSNLIQEASKRGLRVRWCTVSLSNVGLQALASSISQFVMPALYIFPPRLAANVFSSFAQSQAFAFRTDCVTPLAFSGFFRNVFQFVKRLCQTVNLQCACKNSLALEQA